MFLFVSNFFEKIKEKIDKKLEPDFVKLLRKENFPEFLINIGDFNKGRESIKEVNREEFREMLERFKPKEVFAKYINTDDFTMWGHFYFYLPDGAIVKTTDYFPATDSEDNIKDNKHGISLEGFPYKEIRYKDISGLYKFIRTEG